MPPERKDRSSAAEWLKRAKSNLIRSKEPKPEGVLFEDLCFDAQQAAEKALKALLFYHNIPFRFVHDIAELLTTLEENGIDLPAEIREAAELSDYAVEARYPSPMEPVTGEEHKKAVDMAEAVVSWVQNQLNTFE